MYGHLADYLRVMWVPIGGFAVGYLTIIVVFAGFYGMLERFQPGAFAGAGGGITEWLSFSFFNALAQDYANFAPASVGARVLVGAHLILSVWVGTGAFRGGDVIHRAQAGPDRAASRRGRR